MGPAQSSTLPYWTFTLNRSPQIQGRLALRKRISLVLIDDNPMGHEGVVALIQAQPDGRYLVNALTPIADFNARFGTQFEDDEFDTIGGLVLRAFGRMPKRGETVTMEGLRFRVLRADSRRLHTVQVERIAPVVVDPDADA